MRSAKDEFAWCVDAPQTLEMIEWMTAELAQPPRLALVRRDEPDLLLWNEIQRDELDNAEELRTLLEDGGLGLVGRARDAREEDVFLLSPGFPLPRLP
jgi:hypothetical protein